MRMVERSSMPYCLISGCEAGWGTERAREGRNRNVRLAGSSIRTCRSKAGV